MALLNYTTKIEAVKTVGEIQGILAAHGATAILIEYGNASVTALSFKIETPHGEVGIRLPADPEAVLRVLARQQLKTKVRLDHAQAVRIAWRIVKDWIEAQLAIIETEMVCLEQVMLPYIITEDGQTLFERMKEQHFLLKEGK